MFGKMTLFRAENTLEIKTPAQKYFFYGSTNVFVTGTAKIKYCQK